MLDPATRKLVAELARHVLRFRARVIGAAVLLILAKVAAVAVPLVLKAIVDVMSRPEALAALPVLLLIGYAAVRFAATLFTELRDLTFARVTQTVVADLSLRTFEHLHSLASRFHVDRATGAHAELRVVAPGAYALLEHERHTAGELELRLDGDVSCLATCFTPGAA